MSLPLRHGILAALSILTLAIGSLLLLQNEGFGVVAGIAIFLGIVSTVLLGLVRAEKWLAATWPLLFLLVGIISGHGLFLFADVLIGGAFSVLFLLLQNRSLDFLKFSFFLIVKPAVRLFLIVVALGLAVGIYVGVPPQSIEATVEEGIENFEKLPLPGGIELSDWIQNAWSDAQSSILEQGFFGNMIEQRINEECGDNEACAEQMREVLRTQQENENSEEVASEEVTEETKSFFQEKLEEFSQAVDFSLVTAALFFFIFLLFSGLFALVLTVFLYPFFLLAKSTKLLQVTTREVEQKLFT